MYKNLYNFPTVGLYMNTGCHTYYRYKFIMPPPRVAVEASAHAAAPEKKLGSRKVARNVTTIATAASMCVVTTTFKVEHYDNNYIMLKCIDNNRKIYINMDIKKNNSYI